MKIVHISLKPESLATTYNVAQYARTLDGFQLNIVNPNPADIIRLKHVMQKIEFIYQLKPAVLTDLKAYFNRYTTQLDDLKSIDHFLIDSSEGKGIVANIDTIINTKTFMEKLGFTQNSFGFAGGLSALNLDQFNALLPFYSIDAESQLRTNNKLDKGKLQAYLKKAITLIL